MNDYKELIGDIGDLLIAHPSETLCKRLLKQAANAIEQLVKERDEWKTLGSLANKRAEDYREMRRQRDKAIKERDAAIADLKEYCDCDVCKNNNDECLNNGLCKKCSVGKSTRHYWEWRGVKEDNDE